MRIVAYERFPEDQPFPEAWNALVQTMERPQVFYTYEWARAAALAYANSLQPLLLAAFRAEQLVGLAAFEHESNRNQVSFLAGSTADYCDFISTPADREQFILLAMQELRNLGIREVSLANVPADSISAQVLMSNRRQIGFSTFTRPAYVCAQVHFDSQESRIQTRRSVHTKLRRLLNAAGDSDFVVQHHSEWQKIEYEFTQFSTAHVQRFLVAGRVSNLIRCERRTFLIELGRLLSARGWLALSTLQRGARAIAWNYGFRFAGSWFWYQPAFDGEMAEFSPGSYLLCEILRQACDDRQIHTVDLGLGDEEYKKRYAKSGRATLHITATSPSRKVIAVCRYHGAALVKRAPRLERRARTCVQKATVIMRNAADKGMTGALRQYISRALKALSGVSEVSFFECSESRPSMTNFALQPLSFKLLARAAMEYERDPQTLDYVSHAAERLKSQAAEGFALTSESGTPVHFCWVSPFEGFQLSELRQVLKEPAPESVLVFDCWTPLTQRGKGYYRLCLAQVAHKLLAQEKRPWIFSAASNSASLRGIQKSGFVPRFSLKRRKLFFVSRISSEDIGKAVTPRLDLYPAA